MEDIPTRRRFLFAALLVAVLVAVYWPALSGDFLWDDDIWLTRNSLITAPDGLRRIWFSTDAPSQYLPMVYSTFRLEHALWGFDPRGYHLINLGLHASNALLAWRLAASLGFPGAWLGALLFALHPVQVESVAWINERKNVLALFFLLLSLAAWLRSVRGDSGRRRLPYAASIVLLAVALLSKTTAAAMPAVALLALVAAGETVTRRRALGLLPHAALGMGMTALTLWWEWRRQGTSGPEFALPWAWRLLVAGRGFLFYLGKVAWPANLSFSYQRWEVDPGNLLHWLPVAVLVLAAAGAGIALRRAPGAPGRPAGLALLFYLVNLGPLLGFLPLYTFLYSFAADHHQYIALLGPAFLLGAAVCRASDRPLPRKARIALATVLLAALALAAHRRTEAFTGPEALWRDTLAKNPASWMAWANLGKHLAERDRLAEAEDAYARALAIRPEDNPITRFGMGWVLARTGRPAEAVPHFEHAVAGFPGRWDAHLALGEAQARSGQLDQARRSFRRVLELAPGHPTATEALRVLEALP